MPFRRHPNGSSTLTPPIPRAVGSGSSAWEPSVGFSPLTRPRRREPRRAHDGADDDEDGDIENERGDADVHVVERRAAW